MIRGLKGLHPAVFVLAGTHFLVDGFSNIYAPLLPLIIADLNLSLTAAGTLAMAFQIANSVAQVAFGHIADRWRPRVLLLTGPIVTIVCLTLIGLASDFWTLAMILIVGGFGVAAFHPPAAAVAHLKGGERKGLAMSVHITGGSLGFALGPLVFAPFAAAYGLTWTPLLMIPGLLILTPLLLNLPRIDRLQKRHEVGGFGALRPYAKPLTLLYLIVVLRTFTAMSFSTYMPVMLTRQGMSLGDAGIAAGIYLCTSSAGGFIGGALADRFGARVVILWSLALSVPFLATAPLLTGWAFVAVVSVGGFLMQSTLPVNVTFAQTIAPISAATVSSLMLGFAFGTAGVNIPFVGMLADRIGIEYTLAAMAFAPLVAAGLAWPLPDGKMPHTPARASDVATVETTGTNVAP